MRFGLIRLGRRPRAESRPADRCGLKLMKSLRPRPQFAIESLRRPAAKSASSKETIMLDVAFVALGLAVLALMGVYAARATAALGALDE